MDEKQIAEAMSSDSYIFVAIKQEEILAMFAKSLASVSHKLTTVELAGFVAVGMAIYRQGLGKEASR